MILPKNCFHIDVNKQCLNIINTIQKIENPETAKLAFQFLEKNINNFQNISCLDKLSISGFAHFIIEYTLTYLNNPELEEIEIITSDLPIGLNYSLPRAYYKNLYQEAVSLYKLLLNENQLFIKKPIKLLKKFDSLSEAELRILHFIQSYKERTIKIKKTDFYNHFQGRADIYLNGLENLSKKHFINIEIDETNQQSQLIIKKKPKLFQEPYYYVPVDAYIKLHGKSDIICQEWLFYDNSKRFFEENLTKYYNTDYIEKSGILSQKPVKEKLADITNKKMKKYTESILYS